MIKQTCTLFLLFCSLSITYATTITQAEYFFNQDPGFGMGIAIPINTPQEELELNFQANISGLSVGVHQLYIRVKDEHEHWSLISQHRFAILPAIGQNITAFEYFYNQETGVGNGIAETIAASNPAEGEWAFSIQNLPLGTHDLYLRAQDNLGNWSLLSTENFTIDGILDCDNVINPGSIGFDQEFCDVTSADPAPFISLEDASGGSGTLEYLWIFTTDDPASGSVVWYPIEDSDSPSYDSDTLFTTTYFRRCARREDCEEFIAESNILVVQINDCMDDCDLYKVELEMVTNSTCNGDENGTVSYSIVDGTPPFTYILNGQTLANPPSDLPAGNYVLTIIDANDCSDEISFTIEEPSPIIYLAETIEATCLAADGSIAILQIAGGTPPYQFAWSTGETGMSIENLTAGNYVLTITDANECTTENNFEVLAEGAINVNAAIQDISCFGANDGEITLLPSGVAPFEYEWETGEMSATISGLSAGNYNATISDANGCMAIYNTTLIEPDLLTTSSEVSPEDCDEGNGTIDLTTSGGIPPYTYFWNQNIGAIEDPSGLSTGTYKATITDQNGCQIFPEIFVDEIGCFAGNGFEFLAFSGEIINENEQEIHLYWQTNNEPNDVIYAVEHAAQTTDYQIISNWIAYNTFSNYVFETDALSIGKHFFRIRSFSEANGIYFSDEIEFIINNSSSKSLQLFPNPTQENVSISILTSLEGSATCTLFDVHGKTLKNQTFTATDSYLDWNMSSYAAGVYFLEFQIENSRKEVYKLIKL